MEAYKNFKVASYVFAYYLNKADDAEIQRGIDYFKEHMHLDKVYLENHRGVVDITPERMREVKVIFEKNGIETSGGITSTQLVNGVRKPSYYDTFCYTDPDHRKEYLRIVSELAEVFDEIILDDFFFTACRCEMCIEAKGKRSWKEYRLDLMEEVSREIVDLARSINPKINFIIKYPNWYESYQETGYNPGKQKDIFDMIYTGTETRTACYSSQHLQRYESYSIMRLMENTAPGRNGGGWIDLGGASGNLNVWLEQANLTLYSKGRELMLFNFPSMVDSVALPTLAQELKTTDKMISRMGNPIGVKVWEPFNGDGEDQLYNYLGMCGCPFEPTPYFDDKAPVVFFTQSTAEAPDSFEKLEAYVRGGGSAVVTIGYFRKMYNEGIKDLTSVRLTDRHVIGDTYLIDNANYISWDVCKGKKPCMFEVIDYKTNATQSDITLCVDEDNFPVMTEDNYGKGRFFILNVPENFADLYNLPLPVIRNINKHLTMGLPLYVGCEPKCNLFAYDNNFYGVQSYTDHFDKIQIVVRGECQGIRPAGFPRMYTEKTSRPRPGMRGDATSFIPEPPEYVFEIPAFGGRTFFFEIVR